LIFCSARDSIFIEKTIKTEVSKQAGTEHRGLGREKLPEIRAWIPPSLRPQHGLTEEAQRDEVFRKVRNYHRISLNYKINLLMSSSFFFHY
jgi:hypothetical protein